MNKKTKNALTAALSCGTLLVATQIQAQTVITDWTFASDPIAINASPVPDIGSGTATALGMANAYGTPGPSVSSPDIIATGGSSTLTPNAWRVRGAEPSGGTQAANGWSSLAPVGTQGAEFQVSTVGYTGIELSFDIDTTAQAEKDLAVLYTLNGTTWVPASITSAGVTTGAALVNNSSGSDANSIAATYVALSTTAGFNNGITVNLSSISGANNDPTFGVEIVNASTGADDLNVAGTAYNNSSGNWRYDNVAFSGTPTAVPEPSDLALVGLGLAAFAGLRRKRQ